MSQNVIELGDFFAEYEEKSPNIQNEPKPETTKLKSTNTNDLNLPSLKFGKTGNGIPQSNHFQQSSGNLAPKGQMHTTLGTKLPTIPILSKTSNNSLLKALATESGDVVTNSSTSTTKQTSREQETTSAQFGTNSTSTENERTMQEFKDLEKEKLRKSTEKDTTFLTPEMKGWNRSQWTTWIEFHGTKAFNDMTDDEVNQLLYGRKYVNHLKAIDEKLEGLKLQKGKIENGKIEIEIKSEYPQIETQTLTINPVGGDAYVEINGGTPILLTNRTDEEIQATVREQMTATKQAATKALEEKNHPPESFDTSDEFWAMYNSNPRDVMWDIAIKLARTGNYQDIEKLAFEMQEMIRYAKDWLRSTNDVPIPFDLMEIYLPRPTMIDNSDEAVKRRNFIVERVIKFWQASVEKKGSQVNLKSNSYRTVLAAQSLYMAVENYAIGYRMFGQSGQSDSKVINEAREKAVQMCALEYWNAHKPIENTNPGPLPTLDPDYITYRKFCRRWKIKVGSILHQIKI